MNWSLIQKSGNCSIAVAKSCGNLCCRKCFGLAPVEIYLCFYTSMCKNINISQLFIFFCFFSVSSVFIFFVGA